MQRYVLDTNVLVASLSARSVSEDKHFNVLKKDPFSIVRAIKIAEFKIIMGKDIMG